MGSLEESRVLLERKIGYPQQLILYHVGWFQDAVPKDALGIPEIALLWIDADWYESTKSCLEHLYLKVVKHGIVVLDD